MESEERDMALYDVDGPIGKGGKLCRRTKGKEDVW
jgi:hypothetical protein